MEFKLTIKTTHDEVESNPQKWIPQFLCDIVAPEVRAGMDSGSYADSAIAVHWEFEDTEADPADDIRQRMSRD